MGEAEVVVLRSSVREERAADEGVLDAISSWFDGVVC